MAKTKRAKSRSTVQEAVEEEMILKFGQKIGVTLRKERVRIEDGVVEIDGYGQGEDGTIHMVEAWAHIGKAKGSQPKKVLTDVLKLAFTADARRLQEPEAIIKTHILFADEAAADVLRGSKWGAKAASHLKVKSTVITLSDEVKNSITQAQKAQDIRDQSLAPE